MLRPQPRPGRSRLRSDRDPARSRSRGRSRPTTTQTPVRKCCGAERGWRGENFGLNRSYGPGGSALFCCAKRCFEGRRRCPPSQPRSGVIIKPGARAPGARCQRNSRCSFGLEPQRGDMERLAARGWHNAVSPPLGLREVACTQIPGAHAPGFTIPPHFGGSETNTSVYGTGMIRLAVQAQLFNAPGSPRWCVLADRCSPSMLH
jgi:hypothetical protein